MSDTEKKHVCVCNFRLLWFLVLLYSMFMVMSNWFDARLISVHGVVFSPGTIVFPLTFLISDIITEVYGYRHARRAIWAALFCNILFIGYTYLVVSMPSPDYAASTNQQIDKILGLNERIIIASFFSYLVSEPINSYIISKLKVLTNGRLTALRFFIATLISSVIDSLFFAFTAFHGLYNVKHIFDVAIAVWLIKLAIECIGVIFAVKAAKALKRYEKVDIYDIGTDYSLFTLKANYQSLHNGYRRSVREYLD
ncbi:queuosine precursor transporter [Dongshaea marina]|uniref:queuosine precursor transporter n=1 Tax=Dongshaea marina TaxID=2047966 RepID=UPI000D3E5EBB|nr:queuosine precursor transporter [Dongshaea marina]